MFKNVERDWIVNAYERLNTAFVDLQRANIELQAQARMLQSQLAVAQNNFEWARVRLNHVEDERAALLHRIIAVSVPAPRIERSGQESMAETRQSFDELMKTISFEDMGDVEAQRLGVDHEA